MINKKIVIIILLVCVSLVKADTPYVVLDTQGTDNLPTVRLGDVIGYCSLEGCIMRGDINMNNYSIINVNYINVTYINLTTIYGDIYGTLYGFWNGSSDYYTIAQIDQNFTDFAIGIAGDYVPYTGATTDVDLGSHNLTADNITTNNIAVIDFVLSNLLPSPTLTWDLGSGANRWNNLYVADISSEYIDTYGVVALENISADIFISNGDQYCNSTDCYSIAEFLDNDVYDDGWINTTMADTYVPYTGATADVDLGIRDLTATDLFILDDSIFNDDVEIGGVLGVNGTSEFRDDVSIVKSGVTVLEVETLNDTAEFRLLADGTNDLYIYTYGSNKTGTYYGLPKGNTSYVDARGQRLVIGTFDSSPLYLATDRTAQWIVTVDGHFIPADDEFIDIGDYTSRVRDIYVLGENDQGGIHFVEDDGSYGNLSMDDDFNLLWNGNIIVNSSGNTSWVGNIWEVVNNVVKLKTPRDVNLSNKTIKDVYCVNFSNGDSMCGSSSINIYVGEKIKASIGEDETNFYGQITNNDNIAGGSRFTEWNKNGSSKAFSAMTAKNYDNETMSFGIWNNNQDIISDYIGTFGGIGMVADAIMTFTHYYNQRFSWRINPLDDENVSNTVEIMSLDEDGLNVTGNLTIGDRITFKNGESIDNEVDGWIRILGNISATGTIYNLGDISTLGNVFAAGIGSAGSYIPNLFATQISATTINATTIYAALVLSSTLTSEIINVTTAYFSEVFTDKLTVDGNITSDYADFKTKVAKYHKSGSINTLDTNWHNMTWDITVDSESTTGFVLSNENDTITTNFDGIIAFDYCLHPINNGAAGTEMGVLARVIVDDVETRCSQGFDTQTRKSGYGSDVRVAGTVNVTSGSIIRLEYQVDNADLDFEGNSGFDNPVAATIELVKISDLD